MAPLSAPVHCNPVSHFVELFREFQEFNAVRSGSSCSFRSNIRSPMPVMRDPCLRRVRQELKDPQIVVIHRRVPQAVTLKKRER